MSDPLSITVACVALIDFTEKLITIGKDFANARQDLQQIKDNLVTIQDILKRIDQRKKGANETDPWFQGILRLERTSGKLSSDWKYEPNSEGKSEGALARLKMNLAKLHGMLEPHGLMKRHFIQRFTWHWYKETFAGMVGDIIICRSEISDILDHDQWELSRHHLQVSEAARQEGGDTHRQVRALVDFQKEKKDKKRRDDEEAECARIQQWLSPLEYQATQKTLFANSFPVGQWLLDSLAFKHWSTGRPWYLRCYGDAGSGKTILSAIVIDHLQQKSKDSNISVICLYLDYKESRIQTMENLLGSLLKQLIQLRTLKESSAISPNLRQAYRSANAIKADPTKEDLRELLQAELLNYKRTYLVVDALDECGPPARQFELLAELCKLQQHNLSLMIASRRLDGEDVPNIVDCSACGAEDIKIYYHCEICDQGQFDICQECKDQKTPCRNVSHNQSEPYYKVEVEVKTPDSDIQRYVNFEIGRETKDYGAPYWDKRIYPNRPDSTRLDRKLRKDPELRDKISSIIIEKSKNRFLYAKLYMDAIKAKQTLEDIEETLYSFPDELNDVYKGAMERVRGPDNRGDRDLGLKTLAFVVGAHQRLSLSELQHALAIRPGDTGYNKRRDYDADEIRLSTTGLISIDSNKTVRLVHATLQDYLDETRQEWCPEMEVNMADTCLTCLNYETFSKPCRYSEEFEAKKAENPFIAYASRFWGEHVREASPHRDLRDKTMAFVSQPRRVDAYIQAAWFTHDGSDGSWDVRRDIDGRHVCAWFGISTIIPELERVEKDVDMPERTYGQTPLMYACRRGHAEVVRELLNLGASLDLVSDLGRTALWEAIRPNHEEIVGILLDRIRLDGNDLSLTSINLENHNRTALMAAANLGFFSIVSRLLEFDAVNVNLQDSHGLTALSIACLKPCYVTVKVLLEKDGIDVNSSDLIAGRTALMLAAETNQFDIVKLLLQNGADPTRTDLQGGTAILRAVDYGSLETITTMLESEVGIDLNITDNDGRGLMHSASVNGHPRIIHLLKENGLDPNSQDRNGLTPLHDASRSGKVEVTKILLELGADSSITDNYRRTPLTVAWQYGETSIMGVLEGGSYFGPGKSIPNVDRLPIWSLARLGLIDQLKKAILRKTNDLWTNEPGSEYTALHWAVEAKQTKSLRILLDNGRTPTDEFNHELRTPLHLAAHWGNLEATTELLNHGADPEIEDRWGTTALPIAQSNKHYPVAVELVEKGAAIDEKKVDVKDLLFAAIRLNNVEAVKCLLKNKADVLSTNSDGISAIQLAKETGSDEMKKVLRSHPSFVFRVKQSTGSDEHAVPSNVYEVIHDDNEDKSDEGYSSQVSDNDEMISYKMPDIPQEAVPFRSRVANEPLAN